MGCRVDQLKDEGSWVVYQSTAGAMFIPMFYNQLSAHLFAHFYSTVGTSDYRKWTEPTQERLAGSLVDFVRTKFGEEPEKHADYDHFLPTSRLREPFDDLYDEWHATLTEAVWG